MKMLFSSLTFRNLDSVWIKQFLKQTLHVILTGKFPFSVAVWSSSWMLIAGLLHRVTAFLRLCSFLYGLNILGLGFTTQSQDFLFLFFVLNLTSYQFFVVVAFFFFWLVLMYWQNNLTDGFLQFLFCNMETVMK